MVRLQIFQPYMFSVVKNAAAILLQRVRLTILNK
jgi:hypothetical protein